MEAHAYRELHQLEQHHWWYRGTRAIYRTLLEHDLPRPCGPVLDVGCGTGGNLDLLSAWGSVVALEPWAPALQSCSPDKALRVQGRAEALPFDDETFGLVAILDVLEHVVDDVGVLCEAGRVCHPSGAILLFTSAFMFLWSQHDEVNRHIRRYTARELQTKAQRAGLTVRRLSYANCLLFPLAAPIRLLQRLCGQLHSQRRGEWRNQRNESHVDMFPVPEPLNSMLADLLALEGHCIRRARLPFGVSLVAVLGR